MVPADSLNRGYWLRIAESDLELLRRGIANEIAFEMCRGKLAEVAEKIIRAELIRLGWPLEKMHDLVRLHDLLVAW